MANEEEEEEAMGAEATTSDTLVATPAPAADQRAALALNSGQAVDTARPLVAFCWSPLDDPTGDERQRGDRSVVVHPTVKKFVLGSPKETAVITQGPGIEVNPFLRRPDYGGRSFWTRDSSRTRVRRLRLVGSRNRRPRVLGRLVEASDEFARRLRVNLAAEFFLQLILLSLA